jgi:hypothetical protein
VITEDERRRMEYEEIYVSYMIKARQVYLARTVVERQCAVNEQRISVLQSNSSFFGRAKRLAEIDQLHQDNEMLKYGIDKANSMLAAIMLNSIVWSRTWVSVQSFMHEILKASGSGGSKPVLTRKKIEKRDIFSEKPLTNGTNCVIISMLIDGKMTSFMSNFYYG